MDKELRYRLTLKDFFKKTMQGATTETKKLDTAMGKLDSTMSGIGKGVAAYAGIASFDALKDKILDTTMAKQRFDTAIMATSYNEAQGKSNIRFLNEQVDELGLNLEAARSGYKTFSGAVMGSRIQGAKANKVYKQVAQATTVMGLTADQQEGAFLALGQMISKGTVQAEELRGQLGERIPGAFQIAARAMKMTTAQLGDAMKDGLIESTDFVTKFGEELQKTFGDKVGLATQSLQSHLNRMSNEWDRFFAHLGDSSSGFINGVSSMVSNFLHEINKVMGATNQMEKSFEKFGAKQFSFIQQKGSMLTGLFPFLGKSKVQEMEKMQEWLGNVVRPSETDAVAGLGTKSALLSERSNLSKRFANKQIDDVQYKREYALISQAIEDVTGNVEALLKAGTKSLADESIKEKKKDSSIGSSTEVYGARPQNINITLDRLGDVTINATNITESADMSKDIFSKKLMEVLNDANQIAMR